MNTQLTRRQVSQLILASPLGMVGCLTCDPRDKPTDQLSQAIEEAKKLDLGSIEVEPTPVPDEADGKSLPPNRDNLVNIYVYVADWCPACKVMWEELGETNYYNTVSKGPYRFIARLNEPDHIKTYPTILFPSKKYDTGWAYFYGWYGYEEWDKVYKQHQQLAKSLPQPTYQLRFRYGNNWTYPPPIDRHLIQGHGFTGQEIAGLTARQMVALHNSDHERPDPRRTWNGDNTQSNIYTPRRLGISDRRGLLRGLLSPLFCPTGNCP